MRNNRLSELLAQGEPAVGHMIMEFSSRGLARITENAGLDFVVIDLEHSGFDFGVVADLLAWYQATTVAPLVRVPADAYHFVTRVMDAGALGIMAPNVQTADEARRVVTAMRYAPEGKRGLALGTAHNDYRPPDPGQYMSYANRNVVCVCQIESVAALENLDAIAATPGIDVLFVGPFDLTHSMGIVGDFEHPRFLEQIQRIARIARRHGKAAGMFPTSLEQGSILTKMGYSVIMHGLDFSVYATALKKSVESIREAITSDAPRRSGRRSRTAR